MPQAHRLNLPTVSVKQQLENKVIWNDARSAEKADFFTIGYTGRKTEEITRHAYSKRRENSAGYTPESH